MYRLAAPVAQKSMQGEEDRHAPQQVPEVERRYVSYSKMKRKTKKRRRALTRALLLLTEKFSLELDRMERAHGLSFTVDQYVRRAAAKKAREQQYALFH